MSELSLTILVVEDEYLIQELVAEALVDGGFETDLAATGEEAVILLQGANSRYRATVTDINLGGGVDGWEVAKYAEAPIQRSPIIYISGGSANRWTINGVANSLLLGQAICSGTIGDGCLQVARRNPPFAPVD